MNTTHEDPDEITIPAAAEVASIIEGRGESSYIGSTKVISVRLPEHLVVRLQALAHKSSKTRNAMIVNLLEVGVEEVIKLLKPETLQENFELGVEAAEAMKTGE